MTSRSRAGDPAPAGAPTGEAGEAGDAGEAREAREATRGSRGAGGAPVFPPFAELYATHVDMVWRALRRMGVRDADIQDALQDVFVVAFRRRDEFEGRSSLRTWLYGIAVRVARKRRDRAAKDRRNVPPEDERLASPTEGPHALAARSEAVRALQEILNRMDEAKREVFVLAEIEHLSAPEMSEVLGIPLNTVYSRLRVARQEFDDAVRRLHARDRGRT